MSKNIVFIPPEGSNQKQREYSINSWQYFCDRYDVELHVIQDSISDDIPLNWHKYYLFDILEYNNIEYNQILIAGPNTLLHPDCPNLFDLSENKYCIIPNEANFGEIIKGTEILSNQFKEHFSFYECGDSNIQIVNKNHKKLFGILKEYYYNNKDIINQLSQEIKINPEQLILNFLIKEELHKELKLLPWKYNMTNMNVREIIGEDMLHTKIGYIMNFNSLSNQLIEPWMLKTYRHLYVGKKFLSKSFKI